MLFLNKPGRCHPRASCSPSFRASLCRGAPMSKKRMSKHTLAALLCDSPHVRALSLPHPNLPSFPSLPRPYLAAQIRHCFHWHHCIFLRRDRDGGERSDSVSCTGVRLGPSSSYMVPPMAGFRSAPPTGHPGGILGQVSAWVEAARSEHGPDILTVRVTLKPRVCTSGPRYTHAHTHTHTITPLPAPYPVSCLPAVATTTTRTRLVEFVKTRTARAAKGCSANASAA